MTPEHDKANMTDRIVNKENKRIPELRFPEFKNDGEWGKHKLKEFGEFFRGFTYSSKDTRDKGLLVIRSGNIQNDNLVLDKGLVFVDKDCPENLRLRNGDIVICMSNGSKPLVGKNAEYKGGYHGNITVGAFCSIMRPVNNFTKYLLQSEAYRRFIATSIGDGGIKNLKNSHLEEFDCVAPKTPQEQQKIASCLSSADSLIDACRDKLEALKKHKKGLMQQLFPQKGQKTPKLRFPEFKNDGEWEEKRLGEVYLFLVTNSYPRNKLNYINGSVKNIHYGDIHTKFSTLFDISKEEMPYINPDIPLKKIKAGNYCKTGDIVFADASEDLEDVGKSIEIVNVNNEKILAGLHTLLARQIDSKIAIGFGGYLFKSPMIRKQIKKESQGSMVLSISGRRLSKISICYPKNLQEQQKIASCLSSADSLIDACRDKLELLKKHKKGLMQRLFPRIEP